MNRSNTRGALAVVLLAAAAVWAQEADHFKVVEVIGNTVKVSKGSATVKVGDRVEIYTIIPEIEEEAQVAFGRVIDVGDEFVLVSIDRGPGKVLAGHRIRVTSGSDVVASPAAPSLTVPASSPGNVAVPTPASGLAPSSPAHATTPGKIWLGARVAAVNAAAAKKANLSRPAGAYVRGVFPDSPAGLAGLQIGDVILKVDDAWVLRYTELVPKIVDRASGESLRITIARAGATHTLPVTLAPLPTEESLLNMIRPVAEQGHAWAQCELGQHLWKSRKEDAVAVEWFRKAADQNDPYAQIALAEAYRSGSGVAKDDAAAKSLLLKAVEHDVNLAYATLADLCYQMAEASGSSDFSEALKWAQVGAERNYPECQALLGLLHLKGKGVPQDDRKAAEWYFKSAQQGNVAGLNGMGMLCLVGRGVAPNQEKAIHYYRLSAEQGSTAGMVGLSRAYSAKGPLKNDQEAAKWTLQAAEQGDVDAQVILGGMYAYGRGVALDYKESYKWFHEAAKKGDPVGEYAIGTIYLKGIGVEKDYALAHSWLKKSADRGYADAQNSLGTMYELGLGVQIDYQKAMDLFHAAAKQNLAAAQYNIGCLIREGKGFQIQNETAVAWYKLAAKQGLPEAQYNLAWMYLNGVGVPADRVEAIAWYLKAAEQGLEVAKKQLRQMGVEP